MHYFRPYSRLLKHLPQELLLFMYIVDLHVISCLVSLQCVFPGLLDEVPTSPLELTHVYLLINIAHGLPSGFYMLNMFRMILHSLPLQSLLPVCRSFLPVYALLCSLLTFLQCVNATAFYTV